MAKTELEKKLTKFKDRKLVDLTDAELGECSELIREYEAITRTSTTGKKRVKKESK